ncbi:uncharacterized PE-PGRS family protein PE_PGRS10-like [Vitis riparia]|uniref:uncharacterized PE-PGRS family protein PE_PGRS10-like n=1 Tax=Vitis riparia TaxID=96939 RepID=UPI00155A3CB7|nr:uncharacterized PE-PGRS family protein PE_PGRS10-like [Vitis riparia]
MEGTTTGVASSAGAKSSAGAEGSEGTGATGGAGGKRPRVWKEASKSRYSAPGIIMGGSGIGGIAGGASDDAAAGTGSEGAEVDEADIDERSSLDNGGGAQNEGLQGNLYVPEHGIVVEGKVKEWCLPS